MPLHLMAEYAACGTFVFDMQILWATNQIMTATLKHISTNVMITFSTVYGSNEVSERKHMWDALTNFASSVQGPWVVMGDLNTVLSNQEKVGGRPLTTLALMELADLMSNLALQDLKWKGAKYTWSNNSCGPRRIMCKLDRVLVNQAWISEFVDSEAIFLPTNVSDHSPVLLQNWHHPTGGRSFKFFNKWTSHPNFMRIVQTTWNMRILDKNGRMPTPMFRVVQKLKLLKSRLKAWSKATYGKQKEAITQTRHHLQLIQQAI